MAWPCITRACCINRFWSELDKGDIAVPLVFTKYSDVTDEQHFHVRHQRKQPHPQSRLAIETQPSHSNRVGVAGASAAADVAQLLSSSVMRQDFRAWKVRPERSCKPKNEYHPSEAPFNNETQYQKDFKPWPIPNKRDHPWIPKPNASGFVASDTEQRSAEDASGVEKSEIADKVQEKEIGEKKKKQGKKSLERVKADGLQPRGEAVGSKGRAVADALNRQIKQEFTTGSSYKNEFKAYADVKPVKPIKAKPQYAPPMEEKASLETSYSATFRGEQVQNIPTDNKTQEHRRIRSLYSEPGKEPIKTEKPSTPHSKPRKTTTPSYSKPVKKGKEKQLSSVRSAKKKEKEPKSAPTENDKKKSKEMNNKLAEAKE
ncbi:microtubule-associated protein 6 homolog [Brienomyrus brachyistius]|uniref:microtubule-associated protein 6 homolog n=1 Tax=Brienomyrus brachyistius TaxID=42636 RepID=UPI0020B3A3FA|nr:microtubule-associated protein 6 homolog [Brienomyrus brachyistius]